MSDASSIVHLAGVQKSFGRRSVLRGVDLEVARGEVVCLIGASGSGKSTILRIVNGLLPVDSGTVEVLGEDLTSPSTDLDALRSRVGIVFQRYNLFPHLSVGRNVMLALRHVSHLPSDECESRARAALEKVGMAARFDARPSMLSGGQQQRVAIARALALQPDVLLLDEVTAALDPELVRGVLSTIEDLASGGITLLVVTHEMAFARRAATRVAFIDRGVVAEVAGPDQLFEEPRNPRLRSFLSHVLDHVGGSADGDASH